MKQRPAQQDGEISLVEVASGEILNSFSAGDSPVLALAFSPDGVTLVSSQCVEEFVDRGNNPHCSRHEILSAMIRLHSPLMHICQCKFSTIIKFTAVHR